LVYESASPLSREGQRSFFRVVKWSVIAPPRQRRPRPVSPKAPVERRRAFLRGRCLGRPTDSHVALEADKQFVRDQLEKIIAHQIDGALVFGRRVIGSNFVLCNRAQAEGS
jgi:hypothetical protein